MTTEIPPHREPFQPHPRSPFHRHQINLFGIVTSASIFLFAHRAFCAAAILALDAALNLRFFFVPFTAGTAAPFFFAQRAC